ncbi:MAG: hypothetical protein H6945_16810 [Zoogloeaceae bacterium]|nr:hypothetical protein [Rhodocyclaceae bacterium]MCP5237401.1 hypothetical protein [Zoogloeaceae bacterium]
MNPGHRAGRERAPDRDPAAMSDGGRPHSACQPDRARRAGSGALIRWWALPALAALSLLPLPPAAASDWLVISGLSHHFQQRRDWREVNPGLGFERDHRDGRYGPWTFSAGYLRNSYDRPSLYVGGRWTPLALGPLRVGAFGLLASGYPSPVLLLPAITAEGRRFGINLLAVPNLPGYSGYVGAQVRIALD